MVSLLGIDFTLLIPFFFVLAVVYGSLEVSKVFESRGVKGIISLVIALFAITAPGLAAFIYQILPYAAAIFIVFFFVGFVMSFFREGEKGGKKDLTLPVIIAGLVLVFAAGQGADILSRWLPSMSFIGNQNFIVAIIIIVILMVLYATYKAKSE
jgi:hypothetical protein